MYHRNVFRKAKKKTCVKCPKKIYVKALLIQFKWVNERKKKLFEYAWKAIVLGLFSMFVIGTKLSSDVKIPKKMKREKTKISTSGCFFSALFMHLHTFWPCKLDNFMCESIDRWMYDLDKNRLQFKFGCFTMWMQKKGAECLLLRLFALDISMHNDERLTFIIFRSNLKVFPSLLFQQTEL